MIDIMYPVARNATKQCDAREAGLACGFFCLQDCRPGSVITAVIRLPIPQAHDETLLNCYALSICRGHGL